MSILLKSSGVSNVATYLFGACSMATGGASNRNVECGNLITVLQDISLCQQQLSTDLDLGKKSQEKIIFIMNVSCGRLKIYFCNQAADSVNFLFTAEDVDAIESSAS